MKIAVSACLLGQNCKYSGGNNLCPEVVAYVQGHEVIPVCPECAGGLPVPRCPAEIRNGTVINRNGENVDEAFRRGAEAECARAADADLAILQPRSPSCGVHQVYDGSFTGTLKKGRGVFAEMLENAGVRVAEPWELKPRKDIRLVAVDMDGTLLNGRKQMPGDFISWVVAHPEIRVAAASGRQIANLLKMFPGMENRMLFMSDNGGLVMEKGEILCSNVMTREDALRTLAVIRTIPGAYPVVCGIRSAYMEEATARATSEAGVYYAKLKQVDSLTTAMDEDEIIKIATWFSRADAAEHLEKLQALGGRIAPLLSGTSWIDVANADVTKGRGLRMLMERLNIPPESCMAFGDYLNDLDMLQSVGESYAMANALPEIKDEAKHMTASNEREGVMRILRELGN